MEREFPIYSWHLEYFDELAEQVKLYVLQYYTERGEIEIYDVKNHRMFLKKTLTHNIKLSDMVLGGKILINGRQYSVIDYGDKVTAAEFGVVQQHTYAMIKPGFSEKIGDVYVALHEAGLQISKIRFGMLNANVAAEFYGEHRDKPFYDELIHYITSGPIIAMDVVGPNAIARWRELIGPTNLEVAKKEAPGSLRARFARSTTENFAHGSDSPQSAQRELALIFNQPSVALVSQPYDTTMCVIRPHAIKEGNASKIIKMITDAGFVITGIHQTNLDVNTANEVFEIYRGVVDFYKEMIEQISSGPCLALQLTKNSPDVYGEFRDLCGPWDVRIAKKIAPNSIRARFGHNSALNAVHCTDVPDNAETEAYYFFNLLLD